MPSAVYVWRLLVQSQSHSANICVPVPYHDMCNYIRDAMICYCCMEWSCVSNNYARPIRTHTEQCVDVSVDVRTHTGHLLADNIFTKWPHLENQKKKLYVSHTMYTEIAKNINLKKSELKVCFSIVNARELLEDTIIYIWVNVWAFYLRVFCLPQ